MMKATIALEEIPVRHNVRTDVELEFLTIDCPNDWDDVKKISKKALLFDGRRFTFSGWNSDRHECYFSAPLGGSRATAKIVK
jgi:hypothetical protein